MEPNLNVEKMNHIFGIERVPVRRQLGDINSNEISKQYEK